MRLVRHQLDVQLRAVTGIPALTQFGMDQDVAFQSTEVAMLGGDLAQAWERSVFDPESLTVAEIRSLDSFKAIQVNLWWSYDRVNWTPEFVVLVDEVLAEVDQFANATRVQSLRDDLVSESG